MISLKSGIPPEGQHFIKVLNKHLQRLMKNMKSYFTTITNISVTV